MAINMRSNPVITIDPLPPHPAPLSGDALSDVFGGCSFLGEFCF
jgi:hypothetical protein